MVKLPAPIHGKYMTIILIIRLIKTIIRNGNVGIKRDQYHYMIIINFTNVLLINLKKFIIMIPRKMKPSSS